MITFEFPVPVLERIPLSQSIRRIIPGQTPHLVHTSVVDLSIQPHSTTLRLSFRIGSIGEIVAQPCVAIAGANFVEVSVSLINEACAELS